LLGGISLISTIVNFNQYHFNQEIAMIIANLDYLEAITNPHLSLVTGSSALAISRFSAIALGHSSFTGTILKNFASTTPGGSATFSSVRVTAIATGGNAYAAASSYSLAASDNN
jgi:hypothetical protein